MNIATPLFIIAATLLARVWLAIHADYQEPGRHRLNAPPVRCAGYRPSKTVHGGDLPRREAMVALKVEIRHAWRPAPGVAAVGRARARRAIGAAA